MCVNDDLKSLIYDGFDELLKSLPVKSDVELAVFEYEGGNEQSKDKALEDALSVCMPG